MPDPEKVIKGLEICANISPDSCSMLCPYEDERDEACSGACKQVLKQDALALLKEQPEIVRCNDCIHAEPERVKDKIWCPVTCSLRSMDWFCADGERKEDR